jgi:hypothetical protein
VDHNEIQDRLNELRGRLEKFLGAVDQFRQEVQIALEAAAVTMTQLSAKAAQPPQSGIQNVAAQSATRSSAVPEHQSVDGTNLRTTVEVRLTKEFGSPCAPLRWAVLPRRQGHAAITIQVDANRGPESTFVRVWVFNPAISKAGRLHEDVASDGDLETLIQRIRAETAMS